MMKKKRVMGLIMIFAAIMIIVAVVLPQFGIRISFLSLAQGAGFTDLGGGACGSI